MVAQTSTGASEHSTGETEHDMAVGASEHMTTCRISLQTSVVSTPDQTEASAPEHSIGATEYNMVVGASVVAQGRKFILTGMDEFTARLMDSDDISAAKKKQAPVAVRLAQRIQTEEKDELLRKCQIKDRHRSGVLSVEDFMSILQSKLYGLSNTDLMDLVSLCKRDDRDFSGEIAYEDFFNKIFTAQAARADSKKTLRLPEVPGQRPGTGSDTVPRSASPQTREAVQWADDQWQPGDIDAQGNQDLDSAVARGDDGQEIDWASGNQYFD